MTNINEERSPEANALFSLVQADGAGLLHSSFNTSTIGTFHVYVYGEEGMRVPVRYNYTEKITIQVDFPCNRENYYLRPNLSSSEDPEVFKVV